MIRAYRIGIEIAATNSVAPVLRVITRDLLGLGREADHLKGKFSAVKIAAVGAFAAMGGVAILGATAKLASYGNKLAEVQSRLRQMGVSAGNVGRLTDAAFAQSMRTPNVDYADALAALMKTRTVLGSSKEARAAAPYVVRAEGVLTNWGMGGPTALAELLKSIELRGGTYGADGKTFSVAALRTNLTDALAAQNIAGKLLTPNVIMRTTKLAGPASQMMNTQAWWTSLAEAAQQMGPSAGRGFAMVLKEFSGGPISRLYAYNLQKYGLAKASGFIHIPHTFQTALKPNALKGSDVLYGQSLFAWTQKILVPTLEAHGVHGKKALLAAVYQTISSQTGSRLVANMITNALSYLRTSKQMQQSMGVSIFGMQMNQSMNAPMKALHGAFESFLMTIGRPLVPVAVKVLNTLTNAIVGMTKWAKVHPQLIRDIVYGMGAVGAGLVAFGTTAVIVALSTLGTVPAIMGASVAAIAAGVGVIIANFNGMHRSLLMAGTAIERFIHEVAFVATHPLADLKAVGNAWSHTMVGHYFEGNGGHWVNHKSAAGSYQTWAPGAAKPTRQAAVPAARPSGADNGLIPTVNIGNWGDGQRAIKHGLAASLSQNQGSTTGFNGRASPFGTPAFVGP
ncbi:hypothetical protein AruPA_18980 [Acidiphilium sp. PA]|uniref:hypothetical protein n=1 Tax=Acidiphilium sp. PA TaxID=2871705 RepID=UPI002243E7A5|nr:hypothetical protein [Acidiphilium sp. PA]MCW8309121.1 hypothetical protein [Acidiphilium sp. PA]